MNSFATRDSKINLKFYKHLKQLYNLRIEYPTTELPTIEDDVSSTYCYYKLHYDISVSYNFIIDLIIFLPLEYVFGSNVVKFR